MPVTLQVRAIRALAVLVAALMATLPACAADRAGDLRMAGRVRTYLVHVPDGVPPPGGFPLVLAFHGGGMQGQGMRRMTGLDALADARGFVVAYPDGIDRHWNDGRSTIRDPQDDVGFVAALIDRLEHDLAIDRGRVYATGLSNGALFAWRLGCDLSARFAAIAPVAGGMPEDIAAACRPARPLAVLEIAGTSDPIMPFGGGAVADFGGRGEGGKVLAAADSAALWARRNACAAADTPRPVPPVAAADPTRILRTDYAGCTAAGTVTLVTVAGGGHAWPGGPRYAPPARIGLVSRQLDASQAIVDFFLSLPPIR